MPTKNLWKIDPTHSEVQFKVKHLVISTVTGSFGSYDGNIEADGENFANAKASFTADINSITTNNEDRDQHLKSDDFFQAEEYPHLKFDSTNFEKVGDQKYKVIGNMTIRDVTKEVELDVVHGGTLVDPYGNTKAGFEISGASDHGVSEAIYLNDPDGNGVELYRDRPRAEWEYAEDGSVKMVTIPLDLEDLLRELK